MEYTVSSQRSGVFVMATEPSELSVYTSKYLTEQERRFLIDNLVVRSVEFSGASNTQIFCRCLIHDLTKQNESGAVVSSVQRGKETVLCLHALSKLTTSWTWIKFAVSLFRQGFNVILMDLPGFGKSSIARDIRCPVSAWAHWDVHLITTFLAKIAVPKVNVLACYDSAPLFFNLVHKAPQVLGKNHVLHNVSEQLSEDRLGTTIKALLTGGIKRRILASFDRNHYPSDPTQVGSTSFPADVVNQLLLCEKFMRQISKSLGFNQLTLAAVSALDVAEICLYEAGKHPGIRPIFGFYPSKSFRIYVSQYLSNENLPAYQAVLPGSAGSAHPLQLIGGSSSPSVSIVLPTPAAIVKTATDKDTAAPNSLLALLPPQPDSNEYSYGVRVRKMQEQQTLTMAMRDSEQEYLQENGEEELMRQQIRTDSVNGKKTDPLVNRIMASRSMEMPTDYAVLSSLADLQVNIEQAIRNSNAPEEAEKLDDGSLEEEFVEQSAASRRRTVGATTASEAATSSAVPSPPRRGTVDVADLPCTKKGGDRASPSVVKRRSLLSEMPLSPPAQSSSPSSPGFGKRRSLQTNILPSVLTTDRASPEGSLPSPGLGKRRSLQGIDPPSLTPADPPSPSGAAGSPALGKRRSLFSSLLPSFSKADPAPTDVAQPTPVLGQRRSLLGGLPTASVTEEPVSAASLSQRKFTVMAAVDTIKDRAAAPAPIGRGPKRVSIRSLIPPNLTSS